MALLFILEDNSRDLRLAVDAGHRAGFRFVEAEHSYSSALLFFEKVVAGREPLPDAIVVDLDLCDENGFELLRLLHRTRLAQQIPVVVWSASAALYEGSCALLGIYECVSKHKGQEALFGTLSGIASRVPLRLVA